MAFSFLDLTNVITSKSFKSKYSISIDFHFIITMSLNLTVFVDERKWTVAKFSRLALIGPTLAVYLSHLNFVRSDQTRRLKWPPHNVCNNN